MVRCLPKSIFGSFQHHGKLETSCYIARRPTRFSADFDKTNLERVGYDFERYTAIKSTSN